MGPSILREEVQAAFSTLKEGKAQEPGGVLVEFIRLLDEEHIDWLTNIFNHVYQTGHIPSHRQPVLKPRGFSQSPRQSGYYEE